MYPIETACFEQQESKSSRRAGAAEEAGEQEQHLDHVLGDASEFCTEGSQARMGHWPDILLELGEEES